MCGIAGVVRLADEPISPEQIKALLIGLQVRGGDATGVALLNGDRIAVHKKDEIAWRYCAQREFNTFLESNLSAETDIVIMHTRAWTKGSPWKNENNHPLTRGRSAVVHNGVIHNDDHLFQEMSLERGAETDSDILRAIVDENGITRDCIRQLQRVRGSCACAAISPEFPGKFILARSGSPLVLGHTQNFFAFASIKEPLYRAMKQWRKWRGLYFQEARPDLKFNPMLQEKAYLFDINELRNNNDYSPWEEEFETCKHYTSPTYRVHDNYPAKQERIAREKAEEERKKAEEARKAQERATKTEDKPVQSECVSRNPNSGELIVLPDKITTVKAGMEFLCRNPQCKAMMEVPKSLEGRKLWELQCFKCKQLLADMEMDDA